MSLKAGKRLTFPIMMLLGVVAVVLAAAWIWALEAAFGAPPWPGKMASGIIWDSSGSAFP